MGTKRLESFFDCFRWNIGVRIACETCGHARTVYSVLDMVQLKLRPSLAFWAARRRLKCGRCGARNPTIRPCE